MPFQPGQSGNPAHQWKPGQSGNPRGRPAGSGWLTSLLRERLAAPTAPGDDRRFADLVVEAIIEKALTGDVRALKLIWERMDGRTPQTIDAGTMSDLEAMTDAELIAERDRLRLYMEDDDG